MGFDRVDKNRIGDIIRSAPSKCNMDVIVGIPDNTAKLAMAAKRSFLYVDHAYFKRGWHTGNFRAVRDNVHQTKIFDRPTDRLKKYEVNIEPWRKTGKEIVIIAPSMSQNGLYDNPNWAMQTELKLLSMTGRPITIKHKKTQNMRDFCQDTWAVVTYASVAGVEAALMGIPVFSTEHCPSWPVNSGRLENIDNPTYPDNRLEWAASLSYATWNTNEMNQVQWKNYEYSLRTP